MKHSGAERRNFATMRARAAEVLRDEGLRGLWFRSLGEIAYRRLLFLDRPLFEPLPRTDPNTAFEVRLLDDPRAYASFRDVPEREVRDRLENAELCFLAVLGKRIIGATWVSLHSADVPYLETRLELADDEAFANDAFTDPEFRGRRIAPQIAVGYMRHLRDRGFRRTVAVLLPENRNSWRACAASGYRVSGLVGYVGIGPLRRAFRVDRAPRPLVDLLPDRSRE